jgi:hypothetical protein
MTTQPDNLAKAGQAVADADAAIRSVRAYLEGPALRGSDESLLSLSAAVEGARAARRAAADACMFLSAEAVDRGISVRELDLSDGPG